MKVAQRFSAGTKTEREIEPAKRATEITDRTASGSERDKDSILGNVESLSRSLQLAVLYRLASLTANCYYVRLFAHIIK